MHDQLTQIGCHPEPWEKVVIILERNEKSSEFVSRIEDIKHDSYLLEMPIRQSGEFNLQKGDVVEVTYTRRDAMYSFKASILDLFEGAENSITLGNISEVRRNQRRKHVRLEIAGKIHFKTLGELKSQKMGPEMAGRLLNISGGGALFESPINLNERELIVIRLSLKGQQPLNDFLAIVKRCEGSRNKGYLVGAEFVTKHNMVENKIDGLDEFFPPGAGTFDENIQKLVVQFVYNQQLEMRKKSQPGSRRAGPAT
jgi:c-di-GMP-binding flagellar brake protein YcgR